MEVSVDFLPSSENVCSSTREILCETLLLSLILKRRTQQVPSLSLTSGCATCNTAASLCDYLRGSLLLRSLFTCSLLVLYFALEHAFDFAGFNWDELAIENIGTSFCKQILINVTAEKISSFNKKYIQVRLEKQVSKTQSENVHWWYETSNTDFRWTFL